MIFKFVVFLVFFQSVLATESTDDEYFQNSVYRALKDKKGQFESQLKVERFFPSGYKSKSEENEKHSFKTGCGLLVEKFSSYPTSYYHLFLDGKEAHSFDGDTLRCFSRSVAESLPFFLSRWAPIEAFDPDYEFKILGPNVLLEVFYQAYEKDKERVKCKDVTNGKQDKKNPKKCSITFNETARLNYEFADQEELTMFPERIEIHLQNRTTGEWKPVSKLIYTNFTHIFGGDQIVSSDLPLRRGCRRMNTEGFPIINTDYGSKFELELEVFFNYTADSPIRFGKEPIYSTRTYSVKMYADTNGSINVADTIDEKTNVSIRTFYNTDTHLLHSVTLVKDQCHVYNLTSNRSLNYFYLQDMFVRKAELFFTRNNYSYLSEFNLDGEPCQVFERKFSYITRNSIQIFRDRFKNLETKNSTDKVTTRKKNNEVPVEHNQVIATHYYPKDVAYWSDNPNQLSIPKKIELTIFNSLYSSIYSELIINVQSFKPDPEQSKTFNATNCIDMDKN